MILYRVQGGAGDSWVTQWEPTLADARATAAALDEAGYAPVHVDRVDVPTAKAGLVEALNLSEANRTNWPGEEVSRGRRAS